jgi:WD40 repeat protein
MQAHNPFKGPKSYEAGDSFYGREEEKKELHKLIRNEALTLLFSRSGTGKSSLIKAGLIPYLNEQQEFYPIYIHLPYINSPGVTNLCDFIIQRCRQEIAKLDGVNFKIEMATTSHPNSLFEFIHGLRISVVELLNDGTPAEYPLKPLLIFDQFEEIFVHPFNKDQLEDLYDEIRYLTENEVPKYLKTEFNESKSEKIYDLKNVLKSKQKDYRIMFAFREEYLPQFESLKRNIPSIKFTNSRYRLEPFSVDTSAQIIVQTAPEIPLHTAETISESLAAKIIGFEQEKVDPFLLSIVCQVIYPQLVSKNNLTEKEIEELVKTAVENYLEKVYSEIGRPTKKFIEKKLITSDGAKNSVNYNEVKDDPDLKHDIDELITNQDYRLLSKGQFLDSEHISILHDRLLPPLKERRRKREAAEKRNELLKVVAIAALICGLIGIWFYNKNTTRNKILTAFAYNQMANDERMNDPTVALRIAQLAYKQDSNLLIRDAFTTAALENALYKTIIHGDSSDIFISCSASATGDSIVTGCANGRVMLWGKDGQPLMEYQRFQTYINSIAFSPNGKMFLTGASDSIARLYKTNTKERINEFPNDGAVTAVAFSPDGAQILIGSEDYFAKLWDTAGRLIRTFRNNNTITSVAFSPDGQTIAIGLNNDTAAIWPLQGNIKEPISISTHGTRVGSIAFSPDGSKLAIGSSPGIITVYYLDPYHNSYNNTAPNPPDYNPAKNPVDFQLFGVDDIRSIAFTPDGTKILTGSSDQIARITDLNGNLVKMLKGHLGPIIYATPSGKKIITASTDATIRLWTIPEMEAHKKDFFDYEHPIISAALSSDEKQIVTGSGNGIGEIWNINSNKPKIEFEVAPGIAGGTCFINSISFSPDDKKILTTSCQGTAILWSLNSENKPVNPIPIPHGRVISAMFSPKGNDGIQILTIGADKTAKLWSTENLYTPIKSYDNDILSAIPLANGYILAAFADSTARLWSFTGRNREIRKFVSDQKSKIICLTASKDKELIVTGSEDRMARVWGKDGKLKMILVGHSGNISSVAISEDKTKIATGSDDGFIRLWQIPKSRGDDTAVTAPKMMPTKMLYFGVRSPVNSVAFFGGGNSLLSTSGNVARIWDVNLSKSELLLDQYQLDAFINQFNELTDAQRKKFSDRVEEKLHK